MRCKQARLNASVHLDGRLSGGDSRDFFAHIEICPDCSTHLDEVADTSMALQGFSRALVPPSLRASIRLAVALERDERRPGKASGRKFRHPATESQ